MEVVTNAANTVQRAIFGDRATRSDNTQNVGRSTTGASTTVDEPHHSRETATDSNPDRRSTGAPEHVTSSPCNQRDKGELSTGSADSDPNSSVFSEDTPKDTDRNLNSPLIGNTDNVSSLGREDVSGIRHGDLEDRSTLEKTKLDAPLGKTEPGSHGTHNCSASLGKTEPESTWLSNQPSGDLGKTEPGKMELGSDDHSTRRTDLGKTEPGRPGHGNADLGKTEGKTEFGKTEFTKSAQGKAELGSFSNYPTNPNRNTNASGSLASDHGGEEPGIDHGTGTPHTSDSDTSPGSELGSGPTNKPSSANGATRQSHISQPLATTNPAPSAVAGVIGGFPGATVEPSAGAQPSPGAQPTHKQQGADKPLKEPSGSGDHSSVAASNTGDPKPLGSDMKLGSESHCEGTGERYERSTGLAADGGDFDATRPGAGREAE